MSEAVQRSYEDVLYREGAFAQTHPARLGAIARLLGQGAVDPRGARVLEIGCGYGLNLLPLAAMLPGARFTGVDLIAAEIAEARRLAAAAGLANVQFEAQDVRSLTVEAGSFDYIIVHGVFSHVPDDAKAALLACCGRALAPQGVAYISYNTYPGWKARESVRDLLNFRAQGVTEPQARLANTRATLAFLDAALAEARAPSAMALRALVADMAKMRDASYFHDDIGVCNDPCYLLQFVQWAAEHRLRYLGDAHLATMSFPDLPAAPASLLADLAPDPLLAEQMMDYVRQRTFRSSLLTRADAPPVALTPAALRACAFGGILRAQVPVPDLSQGQRVRFALPAGKGLETGDAATKALLCVLADAWPRRLPFAALSAATSRLLASASVNVSADLDEHLLRALLDLARRGLIDWLLPCGLDSAATPGETPRVDPLTRVLAAAAQNFPLANRWHENVPLTPALRQLTARLDGTRRSWSAEDQAALGQLARLGYLA